MSNKKYDLIIFDLDGTLANTSKGIFNSVRYTEKEMGFLPIQEEILRRFVGPPPAKMYAEIYGLSYDDALVAAKNHREYGSKYGYLESKLYLEVPQLLLKLRKEGYRLGVATLKKEETAIALLEHHKVLNLFDIVKGMNEKESLTKAEIIKEVIMFCNSEKAVLVGDTMNDYIGAMESGIDFIGVSYGFGFSGQENSINIAKNPKEIENYL